MRYLKISTIIMGIMLLALNSCKKFSDFQTDPNNPTEADPSLELANIEQNAFSNISASAALACRYLGYMESSDNNQYYGWQRSSMGYSSIAQVVKMEQEAERTGKKNYLYIGKFFEVYYILGMSQTFGDIPYSAMMKLMREGNFTDTSALRPEYDTQHDIYLKALNDLKVASDSLSETDGGVNSDIIYGGKIAQWKKLINSYTLRVLMSLSKKEGDQTLDIKNRFNEIVSNPDKYPVFSSNSDNGQLTFVDITGNRYTYYNNNGMKTDYYLDSSFVKILKDFKDPRLFVYGKPTQNATRAGLSTNDFGGYDGVWGSGALSYNANLVKNGEVSQINNRYAYDAINEPSVLMGYAELQFILAEGVVRGWISGAASTYYKAGIAASMEFSDYSNTYSSTDISDYINRSSVILGSANPIQQIITQKYISMFMNCGWQPFYEQRRTGYPVFEVSGSGIVNKVNGVNAVPKRWMYPNDEYTNNLNNITIAVQRQYAGTDNINGIMWLVQ